MNENTARNQRSMHSERQDLFPRRHPDRPPHNGQQIDPKSQGGDPGYPKRCTSKRTRPPLDEDQQELATRYLPLARSMAARMEANLPNAGDELQSAAALALVQAAQQFDRSRGVAFSTYARHRIWGALCDLRREIIRRSRPGGSRSSLAVLRLGKEPAIGYRLIGAEPDKPVGTDLENHEALENWLSQLTPPQARAIRLMYLDGKTRKEVAALVGRSVCSLSRMHQRALSGLHRIYRDQAGYSPARSR